MTDPATPTIRRAMTSAPVRQALLLLLVFFAVDLISVGIVYVKIRTDLQTTLQAELQSEVESFDLTGTPRAMAAIVSARARASDPARMVMVFLRGDGRQVGNAKAVIAGNDVHLVPLDGGAPLSPDGYLRNTRRLAGGILILGVSLSAQAALADTFLTLLLLSLVPTAAISIVAALLLSRRTVRRVARIESALDRLSAGNLEARVDIAGSSDDLGRIAAGVNKLARKQQAATEALRQVTTDIAHDLKTPLQRAAVHVQELTRELQPGTAAARKAEGIADEIDRANGIFSAVLRIAQIEGGNLAASFVPVDLCSVARGIAELYQPVLEEAGYRFSCTIPARPVLVHGDGELLGLALSNLIENAHRHTPPNSSISLSVTAQEDVTSVVVADNGPGIPEDQRQSVLRRFYRLESSRTTPGQGLGLALVSAIAELHNGRMVFEDNDPGLIARLRIPAMHALP